MSKQKVIDTLNSIKNEPIAPLKKDVKENTSTGNHRALMQYNAMLDNITIGAHTITTFEFAGIEWRLRLLTTEEFITLQREVINEAKKNELFEEFYLNYLTITKTLARAMTPSPFKVEGEALFSEKDIQLINYDVLQYIYLQYLDFVYLATKKPLTFTNEEAEAFIKTVKKKPEILPASDRRKLLMTACYYMKYSEHLETMLKPDSNN